MTLYKIIIPAVALFFILSAVSRFATGKQSFRELLLWFFFWGNIALVAIYPRVLDWVARGLGVETGFRALFVISTLFLLYFVLQLYLRYERLDEQLTKLIRHEALRDLETRFKKEPGSG
jgi:hypothetical protein